MVEGGDAANVGAAATAVTSISWSFEARPTTTIRTDFGELDIGGIFGRGGGGGRGGGTAGTPSPTVAARKIEKTEAAIEQIKAEQNKQPLRPVQATGGGCSVQLKIFEVQSVATGDGLYNCYEQTLDNAEWDDETGNDKFDDKDAVNVVVLNLEENDPEPGYVAQLVTGNRMKAFKWQDDAGTGRWVGIPIKRQEVRRAFCKVAAGAGQTIVCYLDVNTTGTEITVTCNVSPSGSALSDCFRHLAAGDPIMVKKIGSTWYAMEGFQKWKICT